MTDKTQDRLRIKSLKHGLEAWVGRERALKKRLEQQQTALQQAEEALGAYADKTAAWEVFVPDSYSGQCWLFNWDGNKGDHPWDIAQAALTAIQKLKSTSHPQRDPSQDQE